MNLRLVFCDGPTLPGTLDAAQFEAGLADVLDHAAGYTAEWILERIRDRAMLVSALVDEAGLSRGFCLLGVNEFPTLKVLYVYGMALWERKRPDWRDSLVAELDALARAWGCHAIRFWTSRRGWARWTGLRGFHEIGVEYERRLGG